MLQIIRRKEDPMVVFRAVILWDYNVDSRDKMNALFPDQAQDAWYREKLDLISSLSLSAWIGQFDYRTHCKVVDLALEKYGDAAKKWVKLSEEFEAR